MWAKASISPLFELAREAGKRSRSAKPIVHISTGFAVTEIIRGELAIGRGHSRYTLVFGRSCADLHHDAVMRIGGEAPGRQAHSLGRRDSHACLGSPPPRIVMGNRA